MLAQPDSSDIGVVEKLLAARYSCRAFKPDPVPRATIERVLAAAQKTASWCNSQPWQVTIFSGDAVKAFGETEFWFAIVKIVAIVALIVVGVVMVAVSFREPTGAHAAVANLWNDGGIFPNGFMGFLAGFLGTGENVVALLRCIAKRSGQEFQRGERVLRAAHLGRDAGLAVQRQRHPLGLAAGSVAVLDGFAQRVLDRLDPGFQLAPPVLRGKQAFLHVGHLGQRDVETFLGAGGFLGPKVAVGGQRIQPFLVKRLLADRLFARRSGADRVHHDQRGGDDGPGQPQRTADQRDDLGGGPEADEPGLGVGFQEQALFGEVPFQALMEPIGEAIQHVGVIRS